jgi:tRNA (guanine-N7-)-methyltransferase
MPNLESDWRELPSLVHPIRDAIKAIEIDRLLPTDQPFEIELGCGDGSFLAKYAAAWRDRNFIGVERLKGRLKKLDRSGRKASLTNLALLKIEAAYLLRYLLPAARFQAIHVYFPDPWPKAKHAKNRLISAGFPEQAQRVLVRTGLVFLRTDDLDYFAQMEEVFGESPLFERAETPAELMAITTDFEREFNGRGIPTNHAAWRRID